MKLKFFILFSFLILASCNTDTGKKTVADSQPDSLAAVPMEMETTALTVNPASLPAAFILDSLSVEDTALHLHASFHFPVSSDPKLNKLIVDLVKQNTNGYEDYRPGEFDEVSIEAWVSDCSVTRSLVSMCFTDQSFSTGAAHFNHGYTSLNYDTVRHKQVFFQDIFNPCNEKERKEFCDAVLSPDIYADERLEAADLKKNVDFTIDKGSITFYFDDYEKGPSMTTVSVPLNKVRKFLNEDYQWLAPIIIF